MEVDGESWGLVWMGRRGRAVRKSVYEDLDAYDYNVIDVDTGEPISHVVWADDETGNYGQMVPKGTSFELDRPWLEVKIVERHGHIKLVKMENPNAQATA